MTISALQNTASPSSNMANAVQIQQAYLTAQTRPHDLVSTKLFPPPTLSPNIPLLSVLAMIDALPSRLPVYMFVEGNPPLIDAVIQAYHASQPDLTVPASNQGDASSSSTASCSPAEKYKNINDPEDITQSGLPPAATFSPRSGGEIIGHSNEANQSAAASFKAMLERIGSPAPPPVISPVPLPAFPSNTPVTGEVYTEPSSHRHFQPQPVNNDLLSRAFQREYSADWRSRGIEHTGLVSQEAVRTMQDNHLLIGDTSGPAIVTAPSVALSLASADQPRLKKEKPIFSHIPSQVHHQVPSPLNRTSSHRLRLDGLGENRSRNGYGRNNVGGQELGKGVIGNITPGQENTTVVVTEAGCDIPMLRDPWFALPVIKREEGEVEIGPAPAGTHAISLNPDLPPLAVEHPARVWNSMIHSLSSDLQPVIKWDYEKVNHEGEEKHTFWLAHLTLALPPSHPVIADHPLFRTLPKNQYKKEYVSAVEALGGIKRWTGEPKKLKADAINTTLVRCIADDALAWLRAPNGMKIVTDSDQEDDDHLQDEAEKYLRQRMDAFNQSQATVPVAEPASEEIKIDAEDLDVSDPSTASTAKPQKLATAHGQQKVGQSSRVLQSRPTYLLHFMEILDRTLGPHGLNLANSASFSTDWNPLQNRYGCTLTIGVSQSIKKYREDCIHSQAEHAQEAVCKRALELNVEGYLEWLKETMMPPVASFPPPHAVPAIPHSVIGPSTAGSTSSTSQSQMSQPRALNAFAKPFEVQLPQARDWFKELQNFCHNTRRPQPGYVEQVLWREGQPTLVSQILIGKDNFTITKDEKTTEESKAHLARKILVDYFGVDQASA
ncbi:hypothetical protein IAT40_007026 [Kwoniella sp. CBS 6097]